jgi:hypothetical protein
MQNLPALPPDISDFRHRFDDRKKIHGMKTRWTRWPERFYPP